MNNPASEPLHHDFKVPHYVFDPLYLFGETVQSIVANCEDILPISNYDSGDTVEEVIENLRHLPYEVGVFFDSNYQKIYDFTIYSEKECQLTFPNEWLPHLQVFIHNHPNSNWDFSDKDLWAAATLGCPTLIVVCKDYTCVIENWPRDWSHEAPESIRRLEDYRSFIYRHTRTDILLDGLMGLFAKAGLHTKYSIYDIKGNLVYEAPSPDIFTLPNGELRRRLKAFRHLRYARS